ncbi:hypothetical protein EMIHUDRAFT_460409 [Emiliania huxleyi CCMP1516]|uniref:Aspartyl/asparaginy/proline hydroxylase domain-containing protein n=2 Tax=Emiliania huxleyi TaxID=2903 RepID=A0A0D3KTQ9_EMIH1|nr:hypothetical protein EMIHUDRAFT_460409 [Emiliania huxleyi CCMP1516]EOD39144.1 hypothetical protein EMIHUDRAFT_460409 [Emiliania huxleyi CCMP1516]|eukprot:XP_005791573.1 hypothetical protein EMIHUDRAFT_460409 [Emiliania huxleyi CCMP1516]
MAPHEAAMGSAAPSEAIAYGLLTPGEAGVASVDERLAACASRHLLLELGQACSMLRREADAVRIFRALSHAFAAGGASRAAAAAEHPVLADDARARLFERELAMERGLWRSTLQRPLEHYARSLTARPFWEASELPEAAALQRAFPAILAECNALLARRGGAFAPYRSRVVAAGGAWSDVQLFGGCRADAEHCAACPRTAAAIAAQPRLNSVVHGSHFFSRLAAGTHLEAHCGPSNYRLRCHLGLVVPAGARIRVGEEVREWRAGECLVFDDSYEHEARRAPSRPAPVPVWHSGDTDRVVLICDLWHPEVDLEKHVRPSLAPAQREALAAAEAGGMFCEYMGHDVSNMRGCPC